MIVFSPQQRTRQPHYFQGSSLRSMRDADATARQWLRAKSVTHNTNGTNSQQFFLLQKLARQRRIKPGGSGSTSGGMSFKGEYNGGPYASQNVVVFTPDGGAAGTYIALKGVPAGIAPDIGNPYWMALPFPPSGIWA